MANNIAPRLVEFEQPTDPNYKSNSITISKVFPVTSVIGAGLLGTGAGQIQGNLEFQWTVPQGYRQDVSRSYILFDTSIGRDNAGALAPSVTVAPAFNICSTFFSTGRLELNDYLVSSSNNVPQDDTVFRRLTKSYAKYTTNDSTALMYGSDTNRFDAVQTVLRHQLAWKPESMMSPDMVIPENVKMRLILAINPNINNLASSPAFVSKTNAAGNVYVLFHSIHLVNTYVRVETPIPKNVFIPAYNIKSTYQQATTTSNNMQFTVPKETYKIVIGLQSSAATINAGQTVTKFSSGTGVDGTAQSAYSKLLTGLSLSYAGQQYPSTMYNLLEDTAVTRSTEAYLDFLGACDASFDPSGAESYDVWSDPKVLASVSFGRLFAFNIIKPTHDEATNAELTINFSGAPTTTRVFLFAISKQAIGVAYGDNKSIAEVKPIPFA